MRLKVDRENPNAYRCCLCCHVRTGTILLGLWHLITHLFVICFLVIATVHPELLRKFHSSAPVDSDGYVLETETENWKPYRSSFIDRTMNKDDLCVAYTITVCSTLMSLLLIYGAAKNRAGYLIPFFGLQVFDFCLTCLTVVGYFSYTPDIKLWLKDQGLGSYPGFQRMLEMNGDWLMLIVVTFFILLLSLKAYFLGVVWSCYKFAQSWSANRNVMREFRVDPDTEMLLPPSYEDAIKTTLQQAPQAQQTPPPPPYTMPTATAN